MRSASSPSSRERVTSLVWPNSENLAPDFRRAAHHLGIAALDENVGDRFADRLAQRDRVEMILALGLGALDQGGLVERPRVRQDRAGDLDLVVERQQARGLDRRLRTLRDQIAELGAGRTVDGGNEAAHHLVEHRDVFCGEALAVHDEQVGQPPHHAGAMAQIGVGDGVFKVVDQRFSRRGRGRRAGRFLRAAFLRARSCRRRIFMQHRRSLPRIR